MNAEYNARMTEWTEEVSSFKKTGDEINTYVRELEQKNDDLERANRYDIIVITRNSDNQRSTEIT